VGSLSKELAVKRSRTTRCRPPRVVRLAAATCPRRCAVPFAVAAVTALSVDLWVAGLADVPRAALWFASDFELAVAALFPAAWVAVPCVGLECGALALAVPAWFARLWRCAAIRLSVDELS